MFHKSRFTYSLLQESLLTRTSPALHALLTALSVDTLMLPETGSGNVTFLVVHFCKQKGERHGQCLASFFSRHRYKNEAAIILKTHRKRHKTQEKFYTSVWFSDRTHAKYHLNHSPCRCCQSTEIWLSVARLRETGIST